MTKEEFLQVLRGKIAGRMDPSEVHAQMEYYASYIDHQIAAGKTEEEAVEELGDPFLIAKTLDRAVDGGYLDSDYQYDAALEAENAGQHTGSAYSRETATGYDQSGAAFNDSAYGHASGQGSSGSGQQDFSSRTSYARGKAFQNKSSNTWFARLKKKWTDWIHSESFNRIRAVAVLVIALVVAIACIVLFFAACFQVGGCIIGGLFPIIIAVVILGLLYSVLRK